jgi:ATP-dependent exoDNAse (exonuclease V) alpha subunit
MFTTSEMQQYEREIIEQMRAGQGNHTALVNDEIRTLALEQHSHLNLDQRRAVEEVLSNHDQIMALEGIAGAGKTTSLAAIREAAVRAGYVVEGLAPTSRAAQKLAEAGMGAETLQRHLLRREQVDQERLYILDEASLTGTKQMHSFLGRLNDRERVLLVGDIRQHQSVEAGIPYELLQDAGMRTARLNEVLRQKLPELKAAVVQLARGEVRSAVASLEEQGRLHEIDSKEERIREIAREYVRRPENTLVVSPDNQSRQEINQQIHRELQAVGQVKGEEHIVRVLTTRQDVTGIDRRYAFHYAEGDFVRYAKRSKVHGIEAGEYAQVVSMDQSRNTVTVKRKSGILLEYDPRRQQGVTLYRQEERRFSLGDRVQFTAPNYFQKMANREFGTIKGIDQSGNLRVLMDSGREKAFNLEQFPHLDHGYAVTSYSSQGQTANRVLIHIDSENAHRQLLNTRMAYVSVSRAQFDVQLYTNDKKTLGHELSRDVSKTSALQDHRIVQNAEYSDGRTPKRDRGLGNTSEPDSRMLTRHSRMVEL